MMSQQGNDCGWNRAVLGTVLVLAAVGLTGNSGFATSAVLAGETQGKPHSRPPASRAADESALRSLVAAAGESWNKGDAAGVAAIWAEDGELVAGDGSYHAGRAQITEFVARLLSGTWKGSRYAFEISRVRFLGPDVALLHVNAAFLKPGEATPAPENRAVQSMLAARETSGVWRLTLYHSTRVRPPTPSR